MTARQPRRARRRNVPGDSLPRIRKGAETHPRGDAPVTTSRRLNQNEHAISTDYRYVRKEMAIIGAVTVVTLAFIVAMSFIV